MTKGAKIALAISGVAVLGVGAFFLLKKLRKKDESQGEGTSGETLIADDTPSSSSGTSTTPTRSSSVGCGGGFAYSGFPLKIGTCGKEVVTLQKYLGIIEDGKFGEDTETAVKNSQNLVSPTPIGWTAGYGKVSLGDYSQIANLPTSGRSLSPPSIASSKSRRQDVQMPTNPYGKAPINLRKG